jgi:hypothetical protein
MADKSSGAAAAINAMVKTQDGPVSADDPSHDIRRDAAKDLVSRIKAQIAHAEKDLAEAKDGDERKALKALIKSHEEYLVQAQADLAKLKKGN